MTNMRLRRMLVWDLRLLKRYGIYYAAAFVTVVWSGVLMPLAAELQRLLIPFVVFVDLAVVGFYFLGAMVLLEKEQRSLEGLVVTPLRPGEYLASKTAALTAVSVVISAAVVLAVYRDAVAVPALAAGVVLNSAVFTLAGFIAVSRYGSVSDYLLPSALYLTVLQLPLLDYFGLVVDPLFHRLLYLYPTQGPLVLIRAAFVPAEPAALAAAGVSSLVWVFVLYLLSLKAFRSRVVERKGGRT